MKSALFAVGGFAIALVVTFLVLNTGDDADEDPVVAPTVTSELNDPSDVEAFLSAWRRFRTETFVSDSLVTRTFDDGRTVSFDRRLVQDPPIRIVDQGGSATASGGDEELRCVTDVTGVFLCGAAAGGGARDDAAYAASIEDEQATLATYFTGRPAPYVLSLGDDGCFELEQAGAVALSSFGSRATVCFDRATGALSFQRVRREGADDEIVSVAIRPEVTSEDLSVAGGP